MIEALAFGRFCSVLRIAVIIITYNVILTILPNSARIRIGAVFNEARAKSHNNVTGPSVHCN